MIYIVMGVSGCGKSTVGIQLAKRLHLPFYDADDFHPSSNIDKMSAGTPLTDEDRWPWLEKLALALVGWQQQGGAVLACSALKECYRHALSKLSPESVKFIYLQGTYEQLLSRLNQRKGHFMQANLLQSQLETLEEPSVAFTVPISLSVEAIVSLIVEADQR